MEKSTTAAFMEDARHLPVQDHTDCVVENGQFVPIETTTLSADSDAPAPTRALDADEAPPSAAMTDGKAYTGQTTLFGRDNLTLNGATLHNGRNLMSVDFKKTDFTFADVFDAFVSDNGAAFVLDDVKMFFDYLDNDNPLDDELVITGYLRMNSEPLKAIKDFLKCEGGVYVEGRLPIGGVNLAKKMAPQYITLKSAVQFNLPIMDGAYLKEAHFYLRIDHKAAAWTCSAVVEGKVELTKVAESPAVLEGKIAYDKGVLSLTASTKEVEGLFFVKGLNLENAAVSCKIDEEMSMDFSADWRYGQANKVAFAGQITEKEAAVVASAKDFELKDINAIFRSLTNQDLSLPDFDVTLDDVILGLATADCTVGETELEKGLVVGCAIKVFDHVCKAKTQISTEGVTFTGSVGNFDIDNIHIEEAKLHLAVFTEESKKPSELAIYGKAVIQGVNVSCKVAYQEVDGKWGVLVYGQLQAKSFGLSNIFPEVKDSFVDTLKFSKIALIYSSKSHKEKDPDLNVKIVKGLQLIGRLEEIPAISELTKNKNIGMELAAHIGTKTTISVSMPDARLNLGSGVTCEPFKAAINLTPKPSFDLIFGMSVAIPKQKKPLRFDMNLTIGAVSALGGVTVYNAWEDAFGIPRLTIGPQYAAQMGITYSTFASTGLPTNFGIVGGLALGDVTAEMAVNISDNPSDIILMGSVEQLSPQNLVDFLTDIVPLSVPKEEVPTFFDLKNAKIYVAPLGGNIGTIQFDPGFSLAGDIVLLNKKIAAKGQLSDDGLYIKGHLDRIEIGPLKIGGKQGENVKVEAQLTLAKQAVYVDGMMDFLGSGVSVLVDVREKGITFDFDQNFLDIQKFKVYARSIGSIKFPLTLDFELNAAFDSTITDYLKGSVVGKIKEAVNVVETNFESAKRMLALTEATFQEHFNHAKSELDKAQATADAFYRDCYEKLAAERLKYTHDLQAARQNVEQARHTYSIAFAKADTDLNNAHYNYTVLVGQAERTLAHAQYTYDVAMQAAYNEVARAQADYDNTIGNAVRAVQHERVKTDSLLAQIEDKKHRLNNLHWWEWAYMAPILSVEIASLGTAYGVAQGALFAAEGVLQGIRYGVQYTALEGAKAAVEATRWGGNHVALEGAKNALNVTRHGCIMAIEAARQTVEAVRYGTDFVAFQNTLGVLNHVEQFGDAALQAAQKAVDEMASAPTLMAVSAAKGFLDSVEKGPLANAVEAARLAMEGAKLGATNALWISEAMLSGAFFDIRSATLTGKYRSVLGTNIFKAHVQMRIMGQDHSSDFDFPIINMGNFVKVLFDYALTQLKQYVPGLNEVL